MRPRKGLKPRLVSKRSVDYINDAISILGKYGGSLWVADPLYGNSGSDGNGYLSNNSDVGHVRDLCARYGPELVVNGDFSQGSTGWTVFQPTVGAVTFDGTKATINSTDGSIAGLLKTSLLVVGKVYELSIDVVVRTGQFIIGDNNTVTYASGSSSGKFKAVFTATSTALQIKRGAGGLPNDFDIDNISVREIIGRPLFQATTGFKPKLRRVPKRLGAELVVNGDFATSSDWNGAGGTVAISGGQLTLTSSGLGYAARAENTNPITLKPGATYLLADTGSGGSFRLGTARGLADLYGTSSLPAGYSSFTWQATTSSAYFSLAGSSVSGTQHTFTQASVREVLEWTWAWVFDGTDDLLATVSQPAATEETLIVCKDSVREASGVGTYMAKRGAGFTGAWMYTDTNSDNGLAAGNGTAWQYNGFTPPGNPAKLVMSAVTSATQVKKRTNAINTVNSFSYASGAGPVSLGGYTGTFANSTVFAAAYCPTALSDAELLIIEKAMAQLAGVTI